MLGLCQILYNAFSMGNSHPTLKLKMELLLHFNVSLGEQELISSVYS